MCTATVPCPRHPAAATQLLRGDFFGLMSERLASEGGLISEAALRERWHRQGRPPGELDDWLDGDRLRCLRWASQRWWPAFQFQPDGCTPRADVAVVAAELDGAMDAAEILAWFACQNASLDDETPLARLRVDLPAVLEAARLDRFIG